MVERRRLIVVSNRGPASFSRDEDGKRVARRGGGGLVTALRSLVAHHDVTWLATAMTEEDRAVVAEARAEHLAGPAGADPGRPPRRAARKRRARFPRAALAPELSPVESRPARRRL